MSSSSSSSSSSNSSLSSKSSSSTAVNERLALLQRLMKVVTKPSFVKKRKQEEQEATHALLQILERAVPKKARVDEKACAAPAETESPHVRFADHLETQVTIPRESQVSEEEEKGSVAPAETGAAIPDEPQVSEEEEKGPVARAETDVVATDPVEAYLETLRSIGLARTVPAGPLVSYPLRNTQPWLPERLPMFKLVEYVLRMNFEPFHACDFSSIAPFKQGDPIADRLPKVSAPSRCSICNSPEQVQHPLYFVPFAVNGNRQYIRLRLVTAELGLLPGDLADRQSLFHCGNVLPAVCGDHERQLRRELSIRSGGLLREFFLLHSEPFRHPLFPPEVLSIIGGYLRDIRYPFDKALQKCSLLNI